MSESERESIPQQLRAARRTKGVELEDAYRSTGVSLPVLQGLEAGKYDVVEPVFARMAFGAYVDYLGLDKEALFAQFDAEQGTSLHRVQAVEPSPAPPASSGTGPAFDFGVLRMIGLAAGALVILLIAISLLDGSDTPSAQEPIAREATDGPVAKRREQLVDESVPAVDRSQVDTPPLIAVDPMPEIPEKLEEVAAENMEAARRTSTVDGNETDHSEDTGAAIAVVGDAGEAGEVATISVSEEVAALPSADESLLQTEAAVIPSDEVQVAASINEAAAAVSALNDAGAEEIESVVAAGVIRAADSADVGESESAASVDEEEVENTDVVSAAARARESGLMLLEVEAVDSTWVQINWDESGYFQGIVPRGERRSWQAKSFFRVHSGRAHGLRYTFQGKLLGAGAFGEATKVLRFLATAEGVNLLDADLKPLETAAQP